MRVGTSHFVSFDAACRYYIEYRPELKPRDELKVHPTMRAFTERRNAGKWQELKHWVQNKIDEGEIHIGKPPLKPGEKLSVIHDEGRYQIDDGRP